MFLDEGANRGESLAGKSFKVLNFVRLRHLLAAHLAYCTANLPDTRSKSHTNRTLPTAKDLKAGINQ